MATNTVTQDLDYKAVILQDNIILLHSWAGLLRALSVGINGDANQEKGQIGCTMQQGTQASMKVKTMFGRVPTQQTLFDVEVLL